MMKRRGLYAALWTVGWGLALGACGGGDGNGNGGGNEQPPGTPAPDAAHHEPVSPDDGDAPVTAETSVVQGSAQKGPFERGSMVTIYALNNRAERVGEPTRGQVDDLGRFIVNRLPPDTEWAEVTVDGKSFNEVTGTFRHLDGVLLGMIAPVVDGRVRGNLNLLTPFAMWRVQNLLQRGGAENVAAAREQARGELNEIFRTRHHVDQLDVLHGDKDETRADDDRNLLWFSAAFLSSDITGGGYELMLNDFALDGLIDEPERVKALQRIESLASIELYETARENLQQAYNSAPPAFSQAPALSWLRSGCVPSTVSSNETACVGTQTFTLPAQSGTGLNFLFEPPDSGSYAFSLEQSLNDNRHYAEVYNSFGTRISVAAPGDPRLGHTPLLERGSRVSVSVTPNYASQPNDYVLKITRISDGSAQHPISLLPDVKREGRIGHDLDGVGNQYAYYTVATPARERDHFLIFDNLKIAKIRLEIFDVTGLPHGQIGDNSIFNQVYPSSPHALRIRLPLLPSRVYTLRMTVTEVDGFDVGPLSAPMLMGLRLELGP